MTVQPDPIEAVASLARELGLSAIVGRPGSRVLALDGLRLRPLAVGWATVDLDRAAEELETNGPYEAGPPDRLLGASSRLQARSRSGQGPSGPVVVLLEPFTEGRISALLARRGEGWAALYVALLADPTTVPPIGSAEAALERSGRPIRRGPGPFGPAVLVGSAGSRSAGPAAIVERPPALVVVLPAADRRPGSARRGPDPEGVPSAP
jgi:hypothetical protein